VSRSVSGDLTREAPAKLNKVKQLVESQQDFLLDLLTEHKAQVEEKIQTKARRFASKQLEKQYVSFKELALKIQKSQKKKEWKRAKRAVDELVELIEEHEQDLIIADISPHGWLAVNKLRNSSDLPKAVRKKLAVVEKDLDNQRNRNGGAKKKLFAVSAQGDDNARRKPEAGKKFSPEEALSFAAKQVRAGTCSHCHKAYHYYRECPTFWSRVQESREAQAKGASAAATN
jgi:hypothetical protein